MTIDQDLRDLLTSEADGALRAPASWDDVVRRGVRHRRAARMRLGLVAGGLILLAAVGTLVTIDPRRADRDGLVADDPGTTTTRDLIRPPPTPDLDVAVAQGVFVTVIFHPAAPEAGFDPCTDQSALVTESASEVTVTIQPRSESGLHSWAACESGRVISWGRIELEEPLGDRVLVDVSDRQPMAVVDGPPILFPTWLPDLFDLTQWDGTGVRVNGEHGWSFRFSAGPASVGVHSGAMSGGSCPGETVDVRGTRGTLCNLPERFLLTWIEDGVVHAVDLRTGGADLTADEVLRIADELEPVG